jgi:hypothetical protein
MRLTDQLRSEVEPSRLQQLRRLLIDEVDRLGVSFEWLAKFEQEIAKADERIEFQRAHVATLERAGSDTTAARSLLENLMQIQASYKQYRQRILDAIGRNEL